MPNGNGIQPKTTREHIVSLYGHIKGVKKDINHMHNGIYELGGKIGYGRICNTNFFKKNNIKKNQKKQFFF